MDSMHRNTLPKEKIMDSACNVSNISEYLNRVSVCIKNRQQGDGIVVYRGEPEVYDQPCRPNIFRKDYLNENVFFEKNLFDTMRQNRLTGENRYLDNAIDAQHGEFPSRLLDVSYNCLVALYFAVTPYYHYDEAYMDDQDGMVYLFFIDEIFSPSADNTNDNYKTIINRDKDWYLKNDLFRNNHKFIDHAKQNNRIIAQQGAFILFPGEEPESLPEYIYCGILIPKKVKAQIRQDLNLLFGIHTGSIYPEIINLVKELSSKSRRLNSEAFTCHNELWYALSRLKKELIYYLDYVIEQKGRKRSDILSSTEHGIENDIEKILIHIECRINHYRMGILEFMEYNRETEYAVLEKEEMKQAVGQYNQYIKTFSRNMQDNRINGFSYEKLTIREN
ncbi:MAG: FRG domain-containing protein [Eubacterium sp.]|nr:FRG domain-containing protein [Eubacterium sp.]